MAIRAVVFDLDGVLLDSSSAHQHAFEDVFAQLGLSGFDYSQYAGWRTAEVISTFTREKGLALRAYEVARWANEKTERARMLASRIPVEKAREVVDQLQGRYRLGLASSGSRASVESFIERSGCEFDLVLTGDDVRRAKPDPEIYSMSLWRLAVAAEDCLVVEDAQAGVASARAAGVPVIGIAGTTAPENLRTAGAVEVLDRLSDLPSWLARNGNR